MNVQQRSEGSAALGAAPVPAHTPAPDPNPGGPSGGAGASGGATPIKKEEEGEEETLGELRDRLAPGLARVSGPRATFVHIKVEDSSSGDDTDGEVGGGGGGEATGGEGDREGVEEDTEEEEEEGQQFEHHAQAPGGSLDRRMSSAGAGTVAPTGAPGRPPGATRIQLSTTTKRRTRTTRTRRTSGGETRWMRKGGRRSRAICANTRQAPASRAAMRRSAPTAYCRELARSPDLNNVVRVNGGLDVKCNTEETTYFNILHAALKHSGFKGAGKKVAKCLVSAPCDDDNFMASFLKYYESNDEKKILVPKLRLSLSDAIGCFTRDTRQVGAALYCMGFTNLEFMSRELRVKDVAGESWFLSLGDVDKAWAEHGSEIDTKFESFASFRLSFRGNTTSLVACVQKHIQLDPKRFFSTNTRPMALRALGALDKDYYVVYCSKMSPPLILNPDDLVSISVARAHFIVSVL